MEFRQALASELSKLMKLDEKIIVLDADLCKPDGLDKLFKEYPILKVAKTSDFYWNLFALKRDLYRKGQGTGTKGHRDRYVSSLFRVNVPVPMIHLSQWYVNLGS